MGGSVLEMGGAERNPAPNLAVPPRHHCPQVPPHDTPIPGGPQGGETEARSRRKDLAVGKAHSGGVRGEVPKSHNRRSVNTQFTVSITGGGGAESLAGQGMLRGVDPLGSMGGGKGAHAGEDSSVVQRKEFGGGGSPPTARAVLGGGTKCCCSNWFGGRGGGGPRCPRGCAHHGACSEAGGLGGNEGFPLPPITPHGHPQLPYRSATAGGSRRCPPPYGTR